MGPIGDPKAVCRLELGLGIFWVGGQAGQEPEELHLSLGGDVGGRVQGVAKLRVCDAGLMPKIVSGNTNCPCIMMGDK
ncbi:Oxygen-dependent choline dehydrogenase (CDH) (CHD) (Betaine aldehyde dehydrogenase) (BADH), partial [Durusdinium trenchii]